MRKSEKIWRLVSVCQKQEGCAVADNIQFTFKMATLVDTYEQQYAILTADITGKIGQLSSKSAGTHFELIDLWFALLDLSIIDVVVKVTGGFKLLLPFLVTPILVMQILFLSFSGMC